MGVRIDYLFGEKEASRQISPDQTAPASRRVANPPATTKSTPKTMSSRDWNRRSRTCVLLPARYPRISMVRPGTVERIRALETSGTTMGATLRILLIRPVTVSSFHKIHCLS